MALLEVCASDLKSVRAAVDGGAHRIELCSGLSADGMTPSAGIMAVAAEICRSKIIMNVLIRPDEARNFVADADSRRAAMLDIAGCAQAGASGVVVGALNAADRTIDTGYMAEAIAIAHSLGMTVTCHRAFDITPDPFEAMETLITLGCDCILTSGQAPNALEGAELIARLIRQADGRIDIMPGAGINPANAAGIARLTGCPIMHSSCRRPGAVSSDKETVSQIVNTIKQ